MSSVAAIPAIGLLLGSVIGFLAPQGLARLAYPVLAAGAASAFWAWRASKPAMGRVVVAATFAAGGALLAADAWQDAWRPTLRLAFEDLARIERARAAAERRTLPEDDEAFAMVRGVLRSDAAAAGSGISLSIDVDGIGRPNASRAADALAPVSGGLLVSVVGSLAPLRMDEWRAGRRVRMPVRLRRPSRYLDPGVPDNERALARRGTTLVGTVKSGAVVEVIGRGTWWNETAAQARRVARRAIERSVGPWSERSAAIVTAIVIGDRAGLDDQIQQRLQEAGTYHVIAISGGNIAILAGLFVAGARVAGILGPGAMVAAIGLLAAYASLVGGGPSVARATLMACLYFAGRALDHRSPPLNTLWVTSAVLVSIDPLSTIDPGFLLTFGATFGILVIAPLVASTSQRWPPLVRPILAMGAASLAAETFLFPIGALVFSRVTFTGLALNFLAIPLMGLAQVAGMAVVPLAAVSTMLANIVGFAAHAGAAGLVWSADLVRFTPWLSYRVAPPGWAVVGVYYASLTIWWRLRTGNLAAGHRARGTSSRVAGLIAMLAAVWIFAEPWTWWYARGDGRLHVTFLDVGQGDSVLVQLPGGSTLLVDAGGLNQSSSFDIGDRVVAPVLREAGYRRLDFLALSHGDLDHIGGASAILREFHPREVWEGIPVPRFEPLTKLRLQAQAAGTRWANVYDGDRIRLDEVEIVARHPMPADWERQRVRNDDSLVLELRWRDVSLLLTGDIGSAVEGALDFSSPALVRVLKVPHHGSRTSSSAAFLGTLRPQIAVFSVGRDNSFGHPAPDVLQRYRDIGAAIFRTDQDGAVRLDTDGRSIEIHTFTGRTATYGPTPR